MDDSGIETMCGPVEVDETHVGGLGRNKQACKRRKFSFAGSGRRTIVVGVRDRATKRVRARFVPKNDHRDATGLYRRARRCVRERLCGRCVRLPRACIGVGFQMWGIAISLFNTGIKGTASMKLHRDLRITQ